MPCLVSANSRAHTSYFQPFGKRSYLLISRPNCYCLQKMQSLLKARFQGSSAQGSVCGWAGWEPPEREASGGAPCPAASGQPAGCEGLGRLLTCLQLVGATAETQNRKRSAPQLAGRWAHPAADGAPRLKPADPTSNEHCRGPSDPAPQSAQQTSSTTEICTGPGSVYLLTAPTS